MKSTDDEEQRISHDSDSSRITPSLGDEDNDIQIEVLPLEANSFQSPHQFDKQYASSSSSSSSSSSFSSAVSPSSYTAIEGSEGENRPILPGRTPKTVTSSSSSSSSSSSTPSPPSSSSSSLSPFVSCSAFKAWSFENYRAFALSWVGEDISPINILYIFIFLLSMNLLVLLARLSLPLALVVIILVGLGAVAFFFWSVVKWKYLGAWMVLVPLLMVLALCSASVYLDHYTALSSNFAQDISVSQAPEYSTYDVFLFTDGVVSIEHMGEFIVGSDYFCSAPIIPSTWNSSFSSSRSLFTRNSRAKRTSEGSVEQGQEREEQEEGVVEVTLWAGCQLSEPCNGTDVFDRWECMGFWKQSIQSGLKVYDSDLVYYQTAAKAAMGYYGFQENKKAPFIFWEDPQTLLDRYKSVATDVLASSNTIWIVLTLISLSYIIHKYLLQGSRYVAL